jgi:hypothetical protein
MLENDIWLFGSTTGETNKPLSLNSDRDVNDFFERTIFGMKYAPDDFAFLINFRKWVSGVVYAQYDDRAELTDTNFYVVVEPEAESGNYHIFKCISNNNNSISTIEPTFNSSIQDGIYFLNDGYVWKYMSSTPYNAFRKFSARGLLPVFRNQSVENIASTGIFNVLVENPDNNFGYERITGNVLDVDIQSGVSRIFIQNEKIVTTDLENQVPIFEVPNLYLNRAAFIQQSGPIIGARQGRILSSGILGTTPFVDISTPPDFDIAIGDSIEILPRIVFEGDGTSAAGIAILDSTGKRIIGVRMLVYGDNYTTATARVVDPVGFDPLNINRTDIRCRIRPIVSPKGGHGSNIIKELYCQHLGLSKTITSIGDSDVPQIGSYSKIGVVKNPEFSQTFSSNTFDNRIQIELDAIPVDLDIGDVVSQGSVSGKVHEIDRDNNTIYVIDYQGAFSGTFDVNLPLRINSSDFSINTITYSPYEQKTGKLLSITDLTPISRVADKIEQIRLVIDF